MSRISLCIITKNEEKMLPDCLRSAKDWVDEIVVADTGSDDRTIDIARSLGATVVNHTWRNDFAAARNAALAAATGDWVLVLDADERLAPGVGPLLRATVNKGEFDLTCLPLHNAESLDSDFEAILGGQARLGEPQLLPRLVRRTKDLRWNGAIHESVTEWIVEGKRRVGAAPIHIIHLGAVPDYRVSRQKRARNIGLLKARIEEEPDNPSPYAYLAYEYLGMGDRAQAREAAESAWGLIVAQRHDGPFNHSIVQTANILAHVQNLDGDMTLALETLDQAMAWSSPHPNLFFLRGVALETLSWSATNRGEKLEYLRRGEADYDQCLALSGRLFSEEVNPGATSWAAKTRLGMIYIEQGRFPEAQAAFDSALEKNPGHGDALYGQIEADLGAGDARRALKRAQILMKAARADAAQADAAQGPSPEPFLLGAMACEALGRMDTAMALMARAKERGQGASMAPPRRAALKDMLLMMALHHGRPLPGSGVIGHLGALLGRKPVSPPEGEGLSLKDASPRERGMVEGVIRRLIESGQGQSLEPLLERRAEGLLPGIGDALRGIFRGYGIEVEGEDEPDPVFIGGAGRSGTTLFRAMMDAHPGISCGPEAKLVPVIMGLRQQWLEGMGSQLMAAGIGEGDIDSAVAAFIEALFKGMASRSPGMRIAEKTPHNLLHMKALGGLFPRARFIHILRDGRGVASSLVRQAWVDSATGQPLWYCQSVENGARYWGSVVQQVHSQVVGLEDRFLEVRYESLVQDPKAEMARVMAFLGELWSDDVLNHHQSDVALPSTESSSEAVSEAIHTRAVDGWRSRYTPEALKAVEGIAGPILRELGYLEAEEEDEAFAQAG